MITATELHLNLKKIVISLFIYLGICFSSYVYATDYSITSSTTSQISLNNSDTLTVSNGGSINYTGAAATTGAWKTFSDSTATITNAGTISASAGQAISHVKSTDFSLNNSGMISTANGQAYAVYIPWPMGTTVITNSGTISSGSWAALDVSNGEDVTITNSGTISATTTQAIRANDVTTDKLVINNSGTISGTNTVIYLANSDGITLTNSGTISASSGSAIWAYYTDDTTITNTGTISGSTYGMSSIGYQGADMVLVNKGTITGGTRDLKVEDSDGMKTLTNDQGASDALTYEGYLPATYKFLANSTSDYGKLAVTSGNGTMAFTIDSTSSLSSATYSDVFTGVASSLIGSGTSGTCSCSNGNFNWTLAETSSGSTNWNLTIANADTTAPTTTFSPANSATAVAVASDITLTFNEAVRLINNSALDDSNVDALITLKEDNSSGADIAFDATINGGKTVITINPNSNLSSSQVVYVAIGATVEDASNNAINAANASFTAADVSAPTMAITSAEVSDGASSNDSTLAMTFTSSEATSNFVVGDISVSGGALSSFNATSSTVYTATFTPLDDGAKTIDVAAGTFTDSVSNNNTAATQFNWTYETALPSPLNKIDVTSSVETSKDIAAEWADMSIQLSYNRMAWLRRHQGSIRTSYQGIKLRFRNEMIDILMNSSPNSQIYDEIYFANKAKDAIQNANGSMLAVGDHIKSDAATMAINEGIKLRDSTIGSLNPTFEPIFGDWSVWTKGELLIGKTRATSTVSKQESKSKILSLGFDKYLDNDGLIGFVLDIGRNNTDIGTGATNVKSDNYSLSNYTDFKLDSNTSLESIVGIGRINYDMTRVDGAETLLGERRADQMFFSTTLKREYKEDQLIISPFLTHSATRTNLDAFSEIGGETALSFNDQVVRDYEIGVGLDINSEITLNNNSKLKPFTIIEYNKSTSKTSASMYYTNEGAENAYEATMNNSNNNWKIRLGADLRTETGWRSSLSYTRKQSVGSSSASKYSNSFTLRSDLKF